MAFENVPKVCVASTKLILNLRPSLNIFRSTESFFRDKFWNSSNTIIKFSVNSFRLPYCAFRQMEDNVSSARETWVRASTSDRSNMKKYGYTIWPMEEMIPIPQNKNPIPLYLLVQQVS